MSQKAAFPAFWLFLKGSIINVGARIKKVEHKLKILHNGITTRPLGEIEVMLCNNSTEKLVGLQDVIVKNVRLLDILPTRYKSHLVSYFKQFDRNATTHFVSDMWESYSDISKTFFRNSKYVIDKYHFMRQIFWAFEAVRKSEQKKYRKKSRLVFKRSKTLLNKRYDYLTAEEKAIVDRLLYISTPLLQAHSLKERFLKIIDCNNINEANALLSDWILEAQESGLERFINCSNTFINWSEGILNSFDCPYTNGFTEGCNNKIKVLKRPAYGYRNFKRFRNRILHIFSHKNMLQNKQKSEAA